MDLRGFRELTSYYRSKNVTNYCEKPGKLVESYIIQNIVKTEQDLPQDSLCEASFSVFGSPSLLH